MIVDVDKRMTLAYAMNKLAPGLVGANVAALASQLYGITGG